MFVKTILSLAVQYWPALIVLALAGRLYRNKYNKGLDKYPGPFLAAYTDWWRFFENWSRQSHFTHINLHRKYGDIVRLGPNSLAFADPSAMGVIYGFNKGMVKSEFYPVQQPVAKGQRVHSLFSTRDEVYHARYRRTVNAAFAMTNLQAYEPLVDSTTDTFINETRSRWTTTDQDCDFYRWLQFLALDIIGELTWSKRMGFIEENRDVGGVIKSIADTLAYAGPIGQMPWLDLMWDKNPLRLKYLQWSGNTSLSPTTIFAMKQNADRASELEKIKQDGDANNTVRKVPDFLMKFYQAQHEHPDFMDDGQVIATCNSMISAGSETTAISLSSIFLELMRHPDKYKILMAEIDAAVESGLIADRPNKKVSWVEAQKLPYMDAVIQEGFRLHPAVGLTQEKVVPPQGIEIAGVDVPGDTIVGCNPWVLQRCKAVFGEDVDSFRPERWLEASPEQLRVMKNTMFQFGGGSRTCIGKHIALFDIYKIVPCFLRNFQFEWTRQEQYRHQCVWMVRVQGFYANITERKAVKV